MTPSKDEVKERLLAKLDAILDSPDTTVKDVLTAVKLYGSEFGLFIEKKQINVDVNTVVKQFTDRQLKILSDESILDADIVNIQPRVQLAESAGPSSPGFAAGDRAEGAEGSRSEDQHGVDQGQLGESGGEN